MKTFYINKVACVLTALVALLLATQAQSQVYQLAGSMTTFSNQLVTSAAPLNTYTLPQRTLYLQHGKLLTTTNLTVYGQIGLVDAVSGLTNWTTVAQNGPAQNTNAVTETITVTNEYFAAQYRLLVNSTNQWNLPATGTNISVSISIGP